MDANARLLAGMAEAETKAFDALGRYKFQMFGYWAAIWVHLNHIGGFKQPSPFRALVHAARQEHPSVVALDGLTEDGMTYDEREAARRDRQ